MARPLIQYNVGDTVILSQDMECLSRVLRVGTEVTIIDISSRGYDIVDNRGNRVIECGWIL